MAKHPRFGRRYDELVYQPIPNGGLVKPIASEAFANGASVIVFVVH